MKSNQKKKNKKGKNGKPTESQSIKKGLFQRMEKRILWPDGHRSAPWWGAPEAVTENSAKKKRSRPGEGGRGNSRGTTKIFLRKRDHALRLSWGFLSLSVEVGGGISRHGKLPKKIKSQGGRSFLGKNPPEEIGGGGGSQNLAVTSGAGTQEKTNGVGRIIKRTRPPGGGRPLARGWVLCGSMNQKNRQKKKKRRCFPGGILEKRGKKTQEGKQKRTWPCPLSPHRKGKRG